MGKIHISKITIGDINDICSKYEGQLNEATSDEICNYIGVNLKSEGRYHDITISEEILKKVSEAFDGECENIKEYIKKLQEKIIFNSYIYDEEIDKSYYCLRVIIDSLRYINNQKNNGSFNEEPTIDLEKAIKRAADYLSWQRGYHYSFPTESYKETIIRAKNVKKLLNKFSIENLDIELLKKKQSEYIESQAKKIGGLEIIKRLFRNIESKDSGWNHQWNEKQKRYNDCYKHILGVPFSIKKPVNYLLNLAIKYINTPISFYNEEDWEKFIESTEDFVSLYKVDYSNYTEIMFLTYRNLIEYSSKKLLENSIYTLEQQRPNDMLWILNTFISCDTVNKNFDDILKYTMYNIVEVISSIYQYSIDSARSQYKHSTYIKGPLNFSANNLERYCNLNAKEIREILSLHLSHDKEIVNKDFCFPDDEKADFKKKPIIKISRDEFLMVDGSVCAPSFLEAFFTWIIEKSEYNNINQIIGDAFEEITTKFLKNKNIKTVSGWYGSKKK